MKRSLAHLLTFVTAAIAADQQLVIWVPNECDSFRGLPEELQISFQDLNLHNTGQYHPVVTNINDIYAHYTYNVAYVTTPTSATWSYITTGQHPPTTKLTSSYNAATCPIPGNTTGTVSENSSGASATTTSTSGAGFSSSTDNGATPTTHADSKQTVSTTFATSTTSQKGTETAENTPSTGGARDSSSDTVTKGSTAGSGVFSSVASSSSSTQQSTTLSATGSSETSSSTARYPSEALCFPDLGFWVDPSLPPKTIKDFCNFLDNGKQTSVTWTPAGYVEDDAHKLAIFIELRPLVEKNEFNRKDCFDALETAWACVNGGHGGSIYHKDFRYILFPYITGQ